MILLPKIRIPYFLLIKRIISIIRYLKNIKIIETNHDTNQK